MSKKGRFSISIDERSLGGSVVEDSIEALLLGGMEIGMLCRNVCPCTVLHVQYNICVVIYRP